MEATRHGHEEAAQLHNTLPRGKQTTYYSPAAQIRNSHYNQFSI
jgi:hypothetical protein